MASGKEVVGDEDIPRALIAACKDTYEVVHRVYDRLLATGGAVLPSPYLRLRILRSALTVMREWSLSVFGTTIGSSTLAFKGTPGFARTISSNQAVKDKLTTAANRYIPYIHCVFYFTHTHTHSYITYPLCAIISVMSLKTLTHACRVIKTQSTQLRTILKPKNIIFHSSQFDVKIA